MDACLLPLSHPCLTSEWRLSTRAHEHPGMGKMPTTRANVSFQQQCREMVFPLGYTDLQSSCLWEADDKRDGEAGMCVWEGANAKSLKYPRLHHPPASISCMHTCFTHKYMMHVLFTAHSEGQDFTGKTRTFVKSGDILFHNLKVSKRSCEDSATEFLIIKGQLLGRVSTCFSYFLRSKSFWNDKWRDGLMGFGVQGYFRGRENHPIPLNFHLFLIMVANLIAMWFICTFLKVRNWFWRGVFFASDLQKVVTYTLISVLALFSLKRALLQTQSCRACWLVQWMKN